MPSPPKAERTAIGGSDGVEDRADLVDCLLFVAANRELDEG